jgi:hypothetical protein
MKYPGCEDSKRPGSGRRIVRIQLLPASVSAHQWPCEGLAGGAAAQQFGTESVAEMPTPRFNFTLIRDRLAPSGGLAEALHHIYPTRPSMPSQPLGFAPPTGLRDLAGRCGLLRRLCQVLPGILVATPA